MSILHVDMSVGDELDIDNGRIKIRVGHKSGKRARLSVEADKSINIDRVTPIRNNSNQHKD